MDPRSARNLTSTCLRRGLAGDRDSLERFVERLTPWLLAQARYRLGSTLRGLYEPEDVVNDAWAQALPHLGGLGEREGRVTPVVLRYLSTTLLFRVRDLVEKHLAGKPRRAVDSPSGLAATASGVVTQLIARERRSLLLGVLDGLADADREVLVLRGIEQRDNAEVAELLSVSGGTASARYRRALGRLRAHVSADLLGDLSPVDGVSDGGA